MNIDIDRFAKILNNQYPKHHFTPETLEQFIHQASTVSGLQAHVYKSVRARGYAHGPAFDVIRQQLLKALEELGKCARHVFDGETPPIKELADVMIPLLVIAQEADGDLLQAVEEKASADVERLARLYWASIKERFEKGQ